MRNRSEADHVDEQRRQPALGYNVKDRKLVVNNPEAETVRAIFRRYLELGSVRELKTALDADDMVCKRRIAANGSPYGGRSFSRGALYQMLQNRVYCGEIVHKGAAYPREHARIVDEELWRQVQEKLEANGVERRDARDQEKLAYLLAGLLFDAAGGPMTPTHAIKKGVRYRYYVSRRLITDVRSEDNDEAGAGQRLPAAELERMVVERLQTFLADADAIAAALPSRCRGAVTVKRALAAAAGVVQVLASEGEVRTFGLLRCFIIRTRVHLDRIDVDLGADRLADMLLGGGCSFETRPGPTQDDDRETDARSSPSADDQVIRLTIPAKLKRAGMEMKFVLGGADAGGPRDAALVRLLIRAHSLARRLAISPSSTLEEVGAREGMGAAYAARLMRLSFLAPDIVVAILNRRQPLALTATKLMADTRLALDWTEQRKALGFA